MACDGPNGVRVRAPDVVVHALAVLKDYEAQLVVLEEASRSLLNAVKELGKGATHTVWLTRAMRAHDI